MYFASLLFFFIAMKIFLILFFLVSANVSAQNANSVWVFGDSAGIDFRNTTSPISISTGMDGRGSCTSIADTLGNLLFYAFTRSGSINFTADIYNRSNQLMQNGDSIQGEAWYNELTIIPKPNNDTLFFLFSMGELGSPGTYYSIINMNGDNGFGSVIQKNIRLNNFRNADCITAVKHGNGRDWWIFSKYSNTSGTTFNRFYAYLISPDSIFSPIIQDFNNSTDADVQRIIFNSDASKMMQINVGGFTCEYDFDRCTGIISNPNIIYQEHSATHDSLIWSGAYSPDDSKFYISTTRSFSNDTTYLIQLDLAAASIPASADTLAIQVEPVQSGTVRLAPDNKIYFTSFYDWGFPGYPYPDSARNTFNENLGVINNPNVAGSGCNFTPFSFNLGGKRTYWGLPNNPNYNMGAIIGSSCDTVLSVGNNALPIDESIFSISPNPFSNKIIFHPVTPSQEKISISVFNSIGENLFVKQSIMREQEINLSPLQSGIYFLTIKSEKIYLTKKIVKM